MCTQAAHPPNYPSAPTRSPALPPGSATAAAGETGAEALAALAAGTSLGASARAIARSGDWERVLRTESPDAGRHAGWPTSGNHCGALRPSCIEDHHDVHEGGGKDGASEYLAGFGLGKFGLRGESGAGSARDHTIWPPRMTKCRLNWVSTKSELRAAQSGNISFLASPFCARALRRVDDTSTARILHILRGATGCGDDGTQPAYRRGRRPDPPSVERG